MTQCVVGNVSPAGTPNSWSLSGAWPGALRSHGTAEAGGLVYVFAGYRLINNAKDYNNHLTEIDPATGVCTRLDAGAGVTGAPPSARSSMGFAALDGVLWVFGGNAGVWDFGGWDGSSRLRDLHAYTIAARAWRQLDAAAGVSGTPPSARFWMGFSAGAGGLLVTYGYLWVRDAHFFDVAAQAWRALPAPPAEGGLVQASYRYGHGQAVLNGTAFVFGGYGDYDYHNDLLTLKLGDAAAQWAAVAAQGDVPAGRRSGALAAVGQQLLLYGGSSSSSGSTTHYSDLALLDPRTGSWTAVTGASGVDEEGMSEALLHAGQVYSAMIEAADEALILADASKFGHRSLQRIIDWQPGVTLITDERPPPPLWDAIRQAEADIIAG